MKYPISSELFFISKVKPPKILSLYPFLNFAMNFFKCKSDKEVKVTEESILGFENAKLKAYIIEGKKIDTKSPGKKLPCLVFFHGGGFLLKASGSHYKIAKEYAKKLPCKVVYVDYRLAPKYPFPFPHEDCYKTYQWVLENSDRLNIDKNKIILAGDSAGGNLAIGVSLMAKDRNLLLPKGALLIYPATDRRMTTKSMKDFYDSPVWNSKLNEFMWKIFLPKSNYEHIEYVSPMEAPSLKDFPKTYIEVAEFDCLRDEGINFYERLKRENVDAKLYQVKKACHGFEAATNSSIVKDAISRRIKWLKEVVE